MPTRAWARAYTRGRGINGISGMKYDAKWRSLFLLTHVARTAEAHPGSVIKSIITPRRGYLVLAVNLAANRRRHRRRAARRLNTFTRRRSLHVRTSTRAGGGSQRVAGLRTRDSPESSFVTRNFHAWGASTRVEASEETTCQFTRESGSEKHPREIEPPRL